MKIFIDIDPNEEFNQFVWRFLVVRLSGKCEGCGSTEKLTAHHKDRNKNNNVLSNGMCLCSLCHQKEHIKDQEEWQRKAVANNPYRGMSQEERTKHFEKTHPNGANRRKCEPGCTCKRHSRVMPPRVPVGKGRLTHCHRGHSLSGDNLYESPQGKRMCRECRNISQREHRKRKSQVPYKEVV